MTDFFQYGPITTLQRLGSRSVEDLEAELGELTSRRNVVLLLPALYSEFEGPAIVRIIEELKKVAFPFRIVVALDRATEEEFAKTKEFFHDMQVPVSIIWQESPRVKELYRELSAANFPVTVPGKGRSVWLSLGYILADKDASVIALHDCDIINYTREIFSRLVYPVIHPALDFEFSKGYYARVTDRLYGRATRLFYTPLINSLHKILRVNRFLEYLGSFRYALSGEVAFLRDLARAIRISPTWGLEVSTLSEVHNKTVNTRICQVELIGSYEHKHQPLDKKDVHAGLLGMVNDVAKTLFRILSQDGIVMSDSFFRSLLTTYLSESRIAIEKYNSLAVINGLEYDRNDELEAAEAFVEALKAAQQEFLEDPIGIPLMPGWVRVRAALPEFVPKLARCVDEENRK